MKTELRIQKRCLHCQCGRGLCPSAPSIGIKLGWKSGLADWWVTGEENLTMLNDKWYSQENILIHEFSHAVMVRVPLRITHRRRYLFIDYCVSSHRLLISQSTRFYLHIWCSCYPPHHAIFRLQDIGLADTEHREAIIEAHRAALSAKLYDPECYMASSPQEYWAEGKQMPHCLTR